MEKHFFLLRIFTVAATQVKSDCIFTKIAELFWKKSWKTAPWSLNLHSAISGDVHTLFWVPYVLRWQGMWR